ncbi:uncharacterized protein LOC107271500 isoform X2 [Cephus cinctus]|uniref:Uncharacterized protein LOC107271500 isoform X2 n=1 Tax=Cephus cinctus TaxID=211228 RepID=A0AAJ7RPV1_CEPCN|nr:uncharacterized protein LOC107271500 isoform X2 [Cephus cinctus]
MELVFSPGRINDNEGDPFQNEEVREWSHVDRLTGMLERARIETGRWQTRNQGAAHSYGKVIDSRERNSADGSVVQKARRQVEIFQSQAAGGRSYQVVRASQWSSSRVTDSTSTSPVPVTFSDTHRKNEADGKVEVKAGFRRAITATEDPGLNRLSQVSRLCRQIHNETLNNKSLTASKLNSSPVTNRRLKRPEVREDGRSLCLLNGKKSTSNEDITNLINEKDTVVPQTKFTRDCRTRRSLQITNSSTDSSWRDRKEANRKMNGTGSVRLSDLSLKSKATTNGTHKIDIKEPDDYSRKESTLTHGENESVQHENIVKKFDSTVGINRNKLRSYVLGVESSSDKETDSSASNVSDATTRRILSTLSFKDTTERDSESSNSGSENSPRRISTLSFKDFNPIRDKNDNSIDNHNEISRRTSKISFDKRDKGDRDFDNYEYHRPQTLSSIANISKTLHSVPSIKSTTSGKSNTTVVHLSSTPSDQDSHLLSKQNIVTVRSSGTNVGTIPVGVLQCRIQSSSVHHPNESLNDLDLERHKEYHLQEELDLRNQVDSLDKNSHTHNDFLGVSLGRPTKKVGFCKTEVHFAADSGKVNIVETDGKPPPSNKFRRRRRGTLGIPVINKNLPHIHFGDTSYEKYIFGGSNTVQGDKITSPDLSNIRKRGEFEKSLKPTDSNVIFDQKNGWGVRLKSILEPEYRNSINVDITSGIGYDNDAKTMDQKIRGHTTTVNLGANVLSKMQHIEQEESGLNNVDELLLNEISETIAIPSPEGRRKEPSIDPVERVCDKKDPVLGKVNKIDSNSVLSSDTENNPVLLKVVTTHKPVTAIVESDRSPDLNKRKIRSTIINKDERVIEHSKKGSRRTLDIMDRRAKHEAKDHCDNSREKITKNSYNKKDNNLDPVYVNVFDATESDVPLYENYQVDNKKESKEDRKDKSVNGERDSPLAELKRVTNETLRSVNERGSKSDSSRKDSKDESNVRESRRVKKHQLDTISESRVNDSEKRGRRKEIKLKGKERRLTSSSTSSIDSIGRMPSETVKRQNSKRHDNKSTGSRDSTESRAKSGNSREGSRDRKRVVDDVSDGKVTRDKGDSVGKEKSKNSTNKIRELAGNINVDKKLNGSTRSKKPIEIVYQTAVYNMKNEKLSKPLKTKESKSPRYINDLICGSKSKRPVDVKRVKATATSQQYTSNKGASQANRYWK